MRYITFIIFSAVSICIVGLSGTPLQAQEMKTMTEQAGATAQAPSALHLVIDGNGFQLTWGLSPQDPGTVTGYEIVRSAFFSGPYETVGKVEHGVSSFVDRTANPEVVYFYKVRALTGGEPSPFSKEAAGEVMKKP